jgi:polynucleotide 5'-hydroxyl-kinase GRC3/NOL9
VLVIGAAEAGKTTFTTWLANTLHARGLRVGIVDADVGQSEIGPPATVGLGAVRGALARTGDAEVVRLAFIGVTSPGRRPWQIAEATGRLVSEARERFDRVLVDTSGFIAGGFAAAVKQRKIAASDPDVVVVIEAADECAHIVRALAGRARPRLVRLPAVRGARPRSVADRRRHRAAALARYFEGAPPLTLSTARVAVRAVGGEPFTGALVAGTLVGLHDRDGATLGVGAIDRASAGEETMTVIAHVRGTDVASVTIGETTLAG